MPKYFSFKVAEYSKSGFYVGKRDFINVKTRLRALACGRVFHFFPVSTVFMFP